MPILEIYMSVKWMKARNKVEDFNMMHREMRFMMENLRMKKNQVKVRYSKEMEKFYKETLEIM
jgi:hypothetical protein